jgi:catechol 2,3-dioxygenase-like lactoylglutathione lyase family enzyme
MIIDHIGFAISDSKTSIEFYTKALAPLGIEKVKEHDGWFGFGKNGKPEFWFGEAPDPHQPMHIAFSADNREQVNQFYNAAIQAGGKDNGEPGLRPEYHLDYYGAFVIDPDGHNIEAVCHKAE